MLVNFFKSNNNKKLAKILYYEMQPRLDGLQLIGKKKKLIENLKRLFTFNIFFRSPTNNTIKAFSYKNTNYVFK